MYKQPSSTRIHDEYTFDSVYCEWRDPVTEPLLHFFTLSKCIQTIYTSYQQQSTLGMNMPIPESRNPRLVSQLGASQGSYNAKDPPGENLGSREASCWSFSSRVLHNSSHDDFMNQMDSRETISYHLSRTQHALKSPQFRRDWERVIHEHYVYCQAYVALVEDLGAPHNLSDYPERSQHLQIVKEVADRHLSRLDSMEREYYAPYEQSHNILCAELAKASQSSFETQLIVRPLPDSWSQKSISSLSTSRTKPIEEVHLRATSVDSQRVSTPKTPNPPERVQLTRSKASPSSTKPDPPSVPRGLKKSPPSSAREFPPSRKSMTERLKIKPLKSTSKTGTPISSPLHRPSMRVKPVEQSTKTVLDREPPKGRSLMGAKPSSRVVLAPASPVHVNRRAALRPPATTRKEVSMEKQGTSAIKHSPVPRAALMLPKSMPVSYIRAFRDSPSKNGTT